METYQTKSTSCPTVTNTSKQITLKITETTPCKGIDIWWEKNNKKKPNLTDPCAKYGGGSMILGACSSYKDIENIIKSSLGFFLKYQDILNNTLANFVETFSSLAVQNKCLNQDRNGSPDKLTILTLFSFTSLDFSPVENLQTELIRGLHMRSLTIKVVQREIVKDLFSLCAPT